MYKSQTATSLKVRFLAITFILFFTLFLFIFLLELSFLLSFGRFYKVFNSRKVPVSIREREDLASSLYRQNPFRKKKERLRILAIGGSTTYGLSVNESDTWPARLGHVLEESFPGKFEVINLGRIGGSLEEFIFNVNSATTHYVSRETLIQLRDPKLELAKGSLPYGWKDLHPNLVLVAPIVNDTAPDYLHLSNFQNNSIISVIDRTLNLSGILRKLALSFYIRKLRFSLMNDLPPARDSETLPLITPQIKDGLAKRLRRFLSEWDNDLPIILFSLPLLFSVEDSDSTVKVAKKFWEINDSRSLSRERVYLPALSKVEREVFSDAKVPYFQLLPDFHSWKFNDRLRLFNDSIHMNERGYSLLVNDMTRVLTPILQKVLDEKKVGEEKNPPPHR